MKIFLPITFLAFCFFACKKDLPATSSFQKISEESDISDARAPRQTEVRHDVDANIGGYLEALPKGYSKHPNKKYPLIVFATAIAQYGNGTTDLYKVATVSLPLAIAENRFPDTFNVKGKKYSFIVLSPQFKATPGTTSLNDMINYGIKNYRVDTTRIYLCGMGVGAGAIWYYSASRGRRLAAIVPITSTAKSDTNWAKGVAASGVPIWAFHNRFDTVVTSANTIGWVNLTTQYHPAVTPKLTLFPEYKHDAWNQAADPTYKENNMSIYEWMLLYKRTF